MDVGGAAIGFVGKDTVSDRDRHVSVFIEDHAKLSNVALGESEKGL